MSLYLSDGLNPDMGDPASPSASVSLSEPTDVPTVLNQAGIDYVAVHDQRLLAIYHTVIFNVVNGEEEVTTLTERFAQMPRLSLIAESIFTMPDDGTDPMFLFTRLSMSTTRI